MVSSAGENIISYVRVYARRGGSKMLRGEDRRNNPVFTRVLCQSSVGVAGPTFSTDMATKLM